MTRTVLSARNCLLIGWFRTKQGEEEMGCHLCHFHCTLSCSQTLLSMVPLRDHYVLVLRLIAPCIGFQTMEMESQLCPVVAEAAALLLSPRGCHEQMNGDSILNKRTLHHSHRAGREGTLLSLWQVLVPISATFSIAILSGQVYLWLYMSPCVHCRVLHNERWGFCLLQVWER
jgi:hypothetical protein